jgi:hypothetical protein
VEVTILVDLAVVVGCRDSSVRRDHELEHDDAACALFLINQKAEFQAADPNEIAI